MGTESLNTKDVLSVHAMVRVIKVLLGKAAG